MITVADTLNYKLQTAGGGCALLLTRKRDGEDLFLQGDDADRFLCDLEAAELVDPERATDDILSDIWADYRT